MDFKTTFDFNEEQLYMFEFLVDQINLTSESKKLIGKTPICVRLKFLDCPVITLIPEEPINTKKKKSKKLKDKSKSTAVDFNKGKSCLFSKNPYELIQELRSKPLQVGIYTMEEKNPPENEINEEKEEFPICQAQVLLSGCLCDQVMMAMNDRNHLPKPYVLKNTYNLADSEGNPFGTITLFLQLSCCGKTIETQFALREKSILFRNSKSSNEFQCFNFPKNIAGENSDEKINITGRKTINKLEINSKQEITENDSKGDIENNPKDKIDRNKSEMEIKELFRTQSNSFNEEEGGNCSNSSTKFQFCGGGLCLGTKVLNPCHGAECPKSPFSRLRGGGCYANTASEKHPQRTIDTNCSSKKHLHGKLSMETLASGGCKSIWKNSAKTGCGCFGKGNFNSKGTCSKNPCTGVDCFIRTLRETQEFVDSLGKVPGLAGLGLMDPTESPFFGRQEDDADTCQPKKKSFDLIRSSDQKTSLILGPHTKSYNKKFGELKSKDVIEPPIVYATKHALPFSLNRIHSDEARQIKVNRKSKKVDNARGKLQYPDAKLQPDVKNLEGGPCGDAECKSRRKRIDTEENSFSINNESAKVPKANEFPNASKSKMSVKSEHNQKIKKRKKGSIQTKNSETSNSSPIKVSKKLMKEVRSLRERNPGVVYGHKNCLDLHLRVPKNMGWLWNSRNVLGRPPPQIGWRPGAIGKYVNYLLKKAKEKSEESDEEDKTPMPVKRKVNAPGLSNFPTFGRHRNVKKEDSNQEIELPPTLHIHRKNGTYYITMYPIKPQSVAQQLVKPLQFKVTKDKEDGGSSASSSVSDMEIEFSPPAAVSRFRPKPEMKTIGTQLKQQEIFDAYKSSNLKTVKIKK